MPSTVRIPPLASPLDFRGAEAALFPSLPRVQYLPKLLDLWARAKNRALVTPAVEDFVFCILGVASTLSTESPGHALLQLLLCWLR